jgi:ferredoxin
MLVTLKWLLVVSFVLASSAVVSRARLGEADSSTGRRATVELTTETTARQIAEITGLPTPLLGEALGLQSPDDFGRSLGDLGLSPEEARQRIGSTRALASEQASKNWQMIVAKFGAWAVFLCAVFVLLRRRLITARARLALLALSVAVFGVFFGPSQSPMGTVKDAVALWGRDHVVFLPRMLALTIFLLGVLLANKFICAWGCQFGVLQDLVFRLGRDRLDRKGSVRQAKAPFVISNAIRIAFFAAFATAALAWRTDLIEPIDPFRIYSPASVGLFGGSFLGLLLVASVFVYRPWCHFLCPFGLIGWVAESASLTHIRVDYDTCVACQQCARACPSTVMEAILKQDRAIPDCFACGVCVKVCPTRSIGFGAGQRTAPPPGKFPATALSVRSDTSRQADTEKETPTEK